MSVFLRERNVRPIKVEDILCSPWNISVYKDFPDHHFRIVDEARKYRSTFINTVEAIIREKENDEQNVGPRLEKETSIERESRLAVRLQAEKRGWERYPEADKLLYGGATYNSYCKSSW